MKRTEHTSTSYSRGLSMTPIVLRTIVISMDCVIVNCTNPLLRTCIVRPGISLPNNCSRRAMEPYILVREPFRATLLIQLGRVGRRSPPTLFRKAIYQPWIHYLGFLGYQSPKFLCINGYIFQEKEPITSSKVYLTIAIPRSLTKVIRGIVHVLVV